MISTRPNPKKRIALSAWNASKLNTIGTRVRIFDATIDQETFTRSEPWALGDGEWVVSVEGRTGGWSCAMLEVLP